MVPPLPEPAYIFNFSFEGLGGEIMTSLAKDVAARLCS